MQSMDVSFIIIMNTSQNFPVGMLHNNKIGLPVFLHTQYSNKNSYKCKQNGFYPLLMPQFGTHSP